MTPFVLSMSVALAATVAVAIPLDNRDATLPRFVRVACPDEHNLNYDMCVNVNYPNGDIDLILLRERNDAPSVLKGHPTSNPKAKVVIILADDDNPDDTIVFKTAQSECTRFSVNISSSGESECLNQAPRPDGNYVDEVGGREPKPTDRSLEERQMFPRALDPNGYKLNVVVYYDDMFYNQFPRTAVTRIEAVMAIVDEMYSEKDTLKTELEVNTVAINRAYGKNWGVGINGQSGLWDIILSGELSDIAISSPDDANLYVFLTGSDSKDGLGLASLGSVCDSSRNNRLSANKYAAGGQKGGDAYTAETVAHEMGHNLGMEHDCLNSNCAHWDKSYVGPRTLNGVKCYGYMDYQDETNYWSVCSVSDFTDYINRQSSFCLEPLDGSTTGGNGGGTVCFDVGLTTKDFASEMSWKFGSCESNQKYGDNNLYTQGCCLAAGTHTLTCMDSFGDGWNGGYLEIGGNILCYNFKDKEEINLNLA